MAVAASASTWFYVDEILRAQQIADAVVHSRPRGNLSDLYPRWLRAGCALPLKAEQFWTFDERQAKCVKAVGLKTS